MNFEQALDLVNSTLLAQVGRCLSDVETAILQGAWQSQTYEQIADASGYSVSYLTRDIGPRFWKLLSQALGEPVSKTNFRSALERQGRKDSGNNQSVVEKADQQEPLPLNPSSVASPTVSPAIVPDAIPDQAVSPSPRCDWGEAVDVSSFCGRTEELQILQDWIIGNPPRQRCRLVALLGMGGIGKSSLSVKLAQEVMPQFEVIVWRSLRNAPSLQWLLSDLIAVLSQRQETQVGFPQLMQWLRSSRCLIVLDNVETLLQAGDRAGQYRPGYEGYGELFRMIAESTHQSCLVLTSREKPTEIAMFEGMELPVRSLALGGSEEVASAVLEAKQLLGSDEEKQRLCQQYGYNPLAIRIIATSIQDLFDGEIGAFLAQDTTIFSNVRKLLDQHFDRLSSLEQTILYWLAINREWTTIAELAADIVPPVSRAALLEALESLRWRSLIEKAPANLAGQRGGCYSQQPVVMEYALDRLIEKVCVELLERFGDSKIELTNSENQGNLHLMSMPLFQSHALIKAQAKDYIRNTQIQLILQPILAKLAHTYRNTEQLQQGLLQVRSHLQKHYAVEPGYAGGNLLNLFNYGKLNLTGQDFSHLTIWQADLQNTNLQQVNFSYADLAKSTFANTLSAVLSVAFSPDQQWLVTADVEGEVRFWRISDGQLLYTLRGHRNWIHSIQFSSDGRWLASGSEDETIRLWDVSNKECLKTLQGHSSRVWSVAFSPDGRWLASGSEDETIRLWDSHTGECCEVLRGHTAGVCSVTFAANDLLISGSADRTIKLWHISQVPSEKMVDSNSQISQCVTTLAGHTDGIWSVSCLAEQDLSASKSNEFISDELMPDELTHIAKNRTYLLASGSRDKTVKLWRVDVQCTETDNTETNNTETISPEPVTAKCLGTLPTRLGWVWSVAFSPNGQLLAGATDAGMIAIWKIDPLALMQAQTELEAQSLLSQPPKLLQGHTSRVWSVAFSPNGQLLASGSKDQTVRLWDLMSQQAVRTLKGYTNWVQTIAFASHSAVIASGHEDWKVRLWDAKTGRCLKTLEGHQHPVWSVAFSPDDKVLASAGEDRTIRLWDTTTGESRGLFKGHTSRIWSIAFNPAGTMLASGSGDQSIKLWNVDSGECINTLQGHTSRIWSIAFNPAGTMLASGSGDQSIKLWNVDSGECINTLQGHLSWIFNVAFSPDGKLLASAASDHTVKLWEVKTGKCLKTIQEQTRLMLSIQFSPDGKTIAVASDDHLIRLWDVKTGNCLKVLQGHAGWVWSIAFSRDEPILASGSQDETLKIWDLKTGNCLRTFKVLRPYEGMNITGVKGITDAQKFALQALGAISDENPE